MHENGRWCETLDTYSISIALMVEWMEVITALGLHKPIVKMSSSVHMKAVQLKLNCLFRHAYMYM